MDDIGAGIWSDDPGDVFGALERIVEGLLEDRGEFVIISAPGDRYVQVLVDDGGGLQLESVSNTFLESEFELTVDDELNLLHMGWQPPSEHAPNWHRTFVDRWPWTAGEAAQLLFCTLQTVHVNEPGELYISYTRKASPHMRVRECDDRCRMRVT